MAEALKNIPTTYLSRRDEDEIDLGAIIGNILGARKLISGCVAVAFLLGCIYAYFAQPIYQVDALVQVEDNKKTALDGAVKDLEGLFETKSQAITEIELLRSRLVMGRTVDALSLDIVARPKLIPIIGSALARRNLQIFPSSWFGYASGHEKIQVTRLEVPSEWRGKSMTVTQLGHERYRIEGPEGELLGEGKVGVELNVATAEGALGVFIRELTGEPGTKFIISRLARLTAINKLSEFFSATEKGKQSGIIALSLKTPSPKSGVDQLNAIANFYVRQNVERKSAEAEQTLDYLEKTLPDTKKELDAAEVRFNSYRSRNGTVDVGKEGELLLEESVKTETGLIELQQKRKELLARFTTEHPSVVAIDNQISILQKQKEGFAGKVDALPRTQQEILRLTRDLQVSQESYTAMLNNAQQLKVVRGGTVGNVRVIDYAVVPLKPVQPLRYLIIFLSLIIGFLSGIAISAFRQALRKGIKDAREIEARLGLSVFATIPQSKQQDELERSRSRSDGKLYLLAALDEQDSAVESLRALRTTLHFASIDAPNKIVLVAGPAPHVGKSFISANLGVVLAKAGEKVLLIDADMRRGHLNEYFGSSRDNGLSDVISGLIEFDQAVRESSINGLSYISTGAIPPNPSELLLHPNFEAMLATAITKFDRIIVDAPPIMAVTDAAIIGRHAGTVLMAVRYAQTPMAELEAAARRLHQAGVLVNGVLLNGLDPLAGYGYGYGYKYGYTYGYTYSYRSQ